MNYTWNNENQPASKEYMSLLNSLDGIFNKPTLSKFWQLHNTAYSHGYNNTDEGLTFIFVSVEELSYNVLFSRAFLDRVQTLLIKSMDEGKFAKLAETEKNKHVDS